NKNKNKNKQHFGLLPKSNSSSSMLEESSRKKRDSWWNSDNQQTTGATRHSMLPSLKNDSSTSLTSFNYQPSQSAGTLQIDTNVHNHNNRHSHHLSVNNSNNNSTQQITTMNYNNKYLTINSASSLRSDSGSNSSNQDYHGNNQNNRDKELNIAQRQSEADEFIQQAIQFHEANELEKATYYFKLAADKDSPLGLFLYGIALRHGWGCKPNAKLAVRCLQKAAESAVSELHESMAANPSIARHELVHGWGVPKKKQNAAYYFEIAANLGDPDAQNDLAFCYYHGEGIKKKAAKYYRMAAAQGAGIFQI
ncbi:11188_t:CDS:2, partial [Diversispora eburnea]